MQPPAVEPIGARTSIRRCSQLSEKFPELPPACHNGMKRAKLVFPPKWGNYTSLPRNDEDDAALAGKPLRPTHGAVTLGMRLAEDLRWQNTCSEARMKPEGREQRNLDKPSRDSRHDTLDTPPRCEKEGNDAP